MIKKIIACAAAVMTISCCSALAAEYNGYIVEVAENAPVDTENTSAEKIIDNVYHVNSKEEAENLTDKENIEDIFPNYIFRLCDNDTPNDYYYPNMWSLQNTHMPYAWKTGLSGENVKIAIVDSGIVEHEDLDSDKIFYRYNTVDGAADVNDVTDTLGHGTAVAGIIAAKRNNGIGVAGVADNAELAIIKVTEDGKFDFEGIIMALELAVEQNCDIINMSLGSPTKDDSGQLLQPMEQEAINSLNERFAKANQNSIDKNGKELLIFAASGNDGNDLISYPAGLNNVIGVGSVNKDNERSKFSQYNSSVDIVAAGGFGSDPAHQFDNIVILNTNPQIKYSLGAGTSYATPFVSGAAALAVEAANKSGKHITRDTLTDLLERSAIDLGEPGKDNEYGWGVLDMNLFVNALYEDGYISVLPATPDPNATPEPTEEPTPEPELAIEHMIEAEKITSVIKYNGETMEDRFAIIGALYDHNGRLVKVQVSDKDDLSEEIKFEFDLTDVDREVREYDSTYKMFMWYKNYAQGMYAFTAISPQKIAALYTPSPEMTPEPEATENPDVTAEPEATENPNVTAEPEATKNPDATVEPETTDIPAESDEPVSTELPKE